MAWRFNLIVDVVNLIKRVPNLQGEILVCIKRIQVKVAHKEHRKEGR